MNASYAQTFSEKLRVSDPLLGTFVKTPAIETVELLALSGLDFICLDAEHAPFDRSQLSACLAMAQCKGLPALVRVADNSSTGLLQALDAGACGVIVPHVDSPAVAQRVARAARFGPGGRGYSGSTRWAGFRGQGIAACVERSQRETLVIAQIEDVDGVDHCESIAAERGIDAIFIGAADLTVSFGQTDQQSPIVANAIERVMRAAGSAEKVVMAFAGSGRDARRLLDAGVPVRIVSSDQNLLLSAARELSEAR